jgi:hypothetical protein
MPTLKYQYEFIDVPASTTNQGTGEVVYGPWVADPATVGDISKPLSFKNSERRLIVLSFTIATRTGPSWFGVAFRERVSEFDSVNIFFHPSPIAGGYNDNDYRTRSGKWPALFRYVQNIGFQLDAGSSNQILLVPIFDSQSWGNCGVLLADWNEIVSVALNTAKTVALWQGPPQGATVEYTKIAEADVAKLQAADKPRVTLKDVVLSCFSAGRGPLLYFYNVGRGTKDFAREIWDFDGYGARLPASTGKLQVIHYDQSLIRDTSSFHVPAWRWSTFPPGAPKNSGSVHGLIPECLAWHATTQSRVGGT